MGIINKDVGRVYDVEDIDYFVLGMAKCGTTSVYDALNNMRKDSALHFHSDFTLFRTYGDKDITTESLLSKRKKVNKPFYVLVPYREPIARKISQYYQYGFPKGKSIELITEEIKRFCLVEDFSMFNSGERTEVDEVLFYHTLEKNTGIDIFSGNSYFVDGNLKLIPYTLESIVYLKKFFGEDFKVLHQRKTEDRAGFSHIKANIKFSPAELDKIYSTKYCEHFYTREEIRSFKEKYSNA